jgi:hypothetical protein
MNCCWPFRHPTDYAVVLGGCYEGEVFSRRGGNVSRKIAAD